MTDLVIVHGSQACEGLIVCHFPVGPTIHFGVSGVVLRRDVPDAPPMSSAFPHLIFEGLSSRLGGRVKAALQALFPVPRLESTRLVSFINTNDWISFRQSTYQKNKGQLEFAEVGPRFELRLFRIMLGTVDTPAAETEYVLRAFLHSRAAVLKGKDSEDEAGQPR
jgi:U3 small nucleolar ribonucleoprotein protein IMP4